jgi:hypothetical protein
MKVFHCDHCDQLLFFENTRCVSCEHLLAFLPDVMVVGSLDALDGERWRSPLADGRTYRLCRNYSEAQVCNWAVDADDDNPLCLSCRLTSVIPDLHVEGNLQAWFKLEVAKRRLIYTLLSLRLPTGAVADAAGEGLAFRFMADAPDGSAPVLTGHANGVITLNIAEADDAQRETRKKRLGEPYRTLLGHLRHEIGHYYWMLLVEQNGSRLARFRELFGDDREDYSAALKRHYEQGPPQDWQSRFVSAYASSHAWEDWAETWAHYLHMVDTLEIAASCGVSLQPRRAGEPSLARVTSRPVPGTASFEALLDSWFPVTYLVNNLNRGLGMADAYPFILSTPAIQKLRFVHEAIASPREA